MGRSLRHFSVALNEMLRQSQGNFADQATRETCPRSGRSGGDSKCAAFCLSFDVVHVDKCRLHPRSL